MTWWKKLVAKAPKSREGGTPAAAPRDGCASHDAIELRQGTADFEWFIARSELETGTNLAHGARHLADLLAFDPARPEWRELLERYAAAAKPDLASLLPIEEKRYYATEALRAYAWHKAGRLGEAIDLLTQVVQAKMSAGYLEAWALDWLESHGAVESLADVSFLRTLMLSLNRFPEARFATMRTLRRAKRWAAISERWFSSHDAPAPGSMVRVGLLRKAGELDAAESLARAAFDREATWHTATTLGLVLREKGEPRRAEEAFEHALRLDPSDVSARLEAGDAFLRASEWASAIRWYEDALSKKRGDWAHASLIYCRWRASGDDRVRAELQVLARGGNERAQELLYFDGGGDAYWPVDATANVLRQMRASMTQDPVKTPKGSVKLALSALESPSNVLAFRMDLPDVNLVITVAEVPSPDPREPIEPGDVRLWRYEGTDPFPGLPPPSDEVRDAIARIAASPLQEDAANASRVAEALGEARVHEVLATMVHPPARPPSHRTQAEGGSALEWIPRVQRVCTKVLGQLGEGWEDSPHRAALYAVLLGPRDWTTIAAIRELGAIASHEPAHAPDIAEAFLKLAQSRPSVGACPWEIPLYRAWLELPHLFPNERDALTERLAELERAT
jgi:tetratricopeptide (TPR) repeat protein